MNCICCNSEVKELYPDWKDVPPMWNSAAAGIIDAGYGSNHDLDSFSFLICDSCISEKLKAGVIKLNSEQSPEGSDTSKVS
jgi:hypothetical protein